MAPSPCPGFTIDFWANDPPDIIEVSCLMPNGILILMHTSPTATIREIKMVNCVL